MKSQKEKAICKKYQNIKRVQDKYILVSSGDNSITIRKNMKVVGACKFCGKKWSPHRITSYLVRKISQMIGR